VNGAGGEGVTGIKGHGSGSSLVQKVRILSAVVAPSVGSASVGRFSALDDFRFGHED
jgi:hypothetical protein